MRYHGLLNQRYSNFRELEERIEKLPTSTEKGEVFEQFVYIYLSLKKNLYQISKIFREKDIPNELRKKYQLEYKDCGIDGLMILKNGKSAAYQVKFRTNRESPSYSELAKSWVEGKHTDYNYTIANCYYLTKLTQKQEKHLNILIDEFKDLDESFFIQAYKFISERKVIDRIRFKPASFQEDMIRDVIEGFSRNDRGKLIAACGTGKTVTSLWITEELGANNILFVAPSLSLIKQTLESWSDQSKEDFTYICVCSDKTVANELEDEGDISVTEFIVPVTTDVQEINEFLSADIRTKKIIFSTYQSLDILANSQQVSPDFIFDITIFDEAHRTAGSKNSQLFSLGLNNNYINSRKRLFMTATERLIRPWIIKKAREYERLVFSMDDENLYGPVFHRFNFGEAIQNKVISDYKIIVAGVSESQVYGWIRDNNWLVDIDENDKEYIESAQNVFSQILIVKSMQKLPIRKVISFHRSINSAKSFAFGNDRNSIDLDLVKGIVLSDVSDSDFYVDHINGSMSAGERRNKLDDFNASKYGIITNSRCLTEGVDVPLIDCVYFVDPKNSLIDIIQACGRALRKPRDNREKIAYFVIPILIPEGIGNEEIINKVDFEMLHNLIQSLRDQDQRLAQWIDELNLSVTKGKTSEFGSGADEPIVIDLPLEFDIREFQEELFIRIADVNADPIRILPVSKKYGRNERKSEYKRIFKTLGDYSYESYRDNLVNPTIERFLDPNELKSNSDLKINHNNVSHTRRLGLIVKKGKEYELSPIGKQYLLDEISFEDLFIRQMLRYCDEVDEGNEKRILFPYRACLKILQKVKTIDYIEFVFGLYGIKDGTNYSINRAISIIQMLRIKYPNIEIVSQSNRNQVLDELNTTIRTNYSATDIWEKKTTINNQYIYFRNHFSLLDDLIELDKKTKTIILRDQNEDKIGLLLSIDEHLEHETNRNNILMKYMEKFIVLMLFNI